ncbi:PLD nuclease N-terminal domain-containing protein [Alkalihalobacillus sp. MEB130]|uniref:PLD nuclease N-terminal domain-containing protein n=1 Tax=Alkalihalobacillus sp. MEB130 TaxID=2976704 RepID=UPI0028DE2339|nr:PLD nuclease N-terminal domain-containing protein [Alkalihalobacillus sp. MEB130]MDT8860403.1 PLD nuclease N-terminal domain-containing protein [Alkalihalobacillus sp. MEB130]
MEISIVLLFFFLLIFGGLILNILTSIWCYRDSLRNGNSKEYSLLWLVATLFFPVIGVIIYLIIRR